MNNPLTRFLIMLASLIFAPLVIVATIFTMLAAVAFGVFWYVRTGETRDIGDIAFWPLDKILG